MGVAGRSRKEEKRKTPFLRGLPAAEYASARSAVQASNVLECIVCDSGLTKYAIIHLILDIGT